MPYIIRLAALFLALSGASFAATVSFSSTSYPTSSFGPGGVLSADLNRDGWPDMIVADTQGPAVGVSVFLATAPGHFGAEQTYSIATATNPESPLAADLNGDGSLDLILRDWHVAVLHILWNNGDGTFRIGPDVPIGNPATSFDLGDFNHDGKLDVAATECGNACYLNVYLGHNDGTFTRSQSVQLAGGAGQLQAADVNGDGLLDLVIARTTQVLVWPGKGNGTFSSPTHLTPNGTDQVVTFTLADFNNDGRLDIVADGGSLGPNCFNTLGTWSYKNMGGTVFSLAWSSSNFGYAGLRRIDMNGDLNQDLIFMNGDVYCGFYFGLLGNGNGTFQTTFQSLPHPDEAADTYVRDLDLDSRDDYISDDGFGGALVALQTGGYKNCAPPNSAKLAAKICTPLAGSTVSSPVLVRASGNSPAGVVQLQVWIDGVKKAVRWHTQLANKFNLSSGNHRITVIATDKYTQATTSTSVNVTVP